ncbi:sensor with HAMP domain protein [Paenibacillus sp. FSL R7-0273]|uniref:sensor histidine kinase n=1 Tax=Paenibacillus sp. FSL R7-0273 TaxID=1536772 RepID=UPI0004F6F52F|nr:sensor histidine kinase [Paenibacillus sp. FSL R7-0273]AIQ46541.1 sensor with HAMP domain protein [Paenibacillus sp. FSL R7-0273]OMF97692.1 sensor with HAMP domain protein [Paenibacillus sp. FSL R7-0273]
MRRLTKYMPFTYKMMIPYLLLVLMTDVFIGYISYSMLTDSRTEMAETNVRTGMEQARNNIRYQMDEIQRMSDNLFASQPFQRAIELKGTPFENYLTLIDDILPQLTAPLQLFGNKIRFMLYTPDNIYNVVPGDNLDEPIVDSDYYILPLEDITGQDWFKSLQDSKRDNIWLQIDTDQKLNNISHVRRLISFSDNKTMVGFIRITVPLEDLFGGFETFPVEEGITLRLVDRAAGTAIFQRGTAGYDSGREEFLSLHEQIPGSDLFIETLVPQKYLTQDAGRLRMVILAACTLSFLVMTLIGFVVARISGRKMSRIVGLVRSFQEGNFQKRIRFSGNDEFVQIADSFNDMAANIQELINRVYVQEVSKKQAELEALQAQINPHFLYNTLSTIGSLANLGEIEKVTRMVEGLSHFYRLTLNQGNVYIELKKEMEQVETYLDIQRVKYADTFNLYVDVDEEIMHMQVIKLLLQPFVENVFKHAWFGKTISIRLTGRRVGDNIELKVIDNGVGMRPEDIRKMMDGQGQTGGYGVKNVNERIKLRYGDEYGVTIASIYGAGTTVQLLLPAGLTDRAEMEEQSG